MLSHAIIALSAVAAARAQTLDPDFYSSSTGFGGLCNTGNAQTPINIRDSDDARMPNGLVSSFTFPRVSGVKLLNKGSALQVEWDSLATDALPEVPVAGDSIADLIEDPSLRPIETIKVQPVQFHFHGVSEHLIEGNYAVAEVHIVSFVAQGERPEWGCDDFWTNGTPNLEDCVAVFGTLFKLGTSSPGWFDAMFAQASTTVGSEVSFSGGFNLNDIIPSNKAYWGYKGSLTTPPCSEGLRWHVFAEQPTISESTLKRMNDWLAAAEQGATEAVARTNHRLPEGLNGRNLFRHNGGGGISIGITI